MIFSVEFHFFYFICKVLLSVAETESKSNLPSKVSADETLVEILDGLIMLYNTTAHKQLGKAGGIHIASFEKADCFYGEVLAICSGQKYCNVTV